MTWSNVSWRASISARISSCRVRSRSAPLTSRTVFSDSISCSISLAQLSRSQACGEQLAHHYHLRYHRLHHLSSPALQIPQMLAWQIILTVYIIMHSNRHTSMLEHCKLAVLSNVNFPAISLNPPPPPPHTQTSPPQYKNNPLMMSTKRQRLTSALNRCRSAASSSAAFRFSALSSSSDQSSSTAVCSWWICWAFSPG